MKFKTALVILIFFFILASTAVGLNKGPDKLVIDGGSKGEVPFPHRIHQDTLNDCQACHAVFPQKSGGIAEMIAAGKLKNKQVMNRQCIKCHRQFKKEGKQHGPTTCTKCHVK